jgi:ATP-binding cassette subfamily F protein 3
MAILTTKNVTKSFGAVDIFSRINVSVPKGARIAIVGPNGVGKTTFLRILVGIDKPTEGKMNLVQGIKIGYLPQEAGLIGSKTLWDECLQAVGELRSMEAELVHLESLMADSEYAEDALQRYGLLQEEFERRGGYVYENRISSTLYGLGFDEDDFNRPLTQLSGGQRTRAFLASLLLSDPDLLILDEPTNHLDIAAVEWLEGYMRWWEGTLVVVSHDRYFLDKVVDHIWEMQGEGLETYRGNYTAYLVQRQERWELRYKIYKAEKLRLEKELEFIKRNIAAQQTLQAKGKLKRLSREVEAIELLGFEAVKKKSWSEISRMVNISDHAMGLSELEQRIRALKRPRKHPLRLHIDLKSNYRSGDLVLRTRDLEIGYKDEGKPLFRSPDLLLKRGECAAIIGPNGAGKTTFLKTLLQIIPPYSGQIILGASLQIGYFAQAHEDLNPAHTLVEEIESVAPNMLLSDIRSYLARFSFTRNEVFKKVSTLSGGERGRLALAILSLSNANLLLLDEPTNHLDIPSQEILQDVLSQYKGTILLVSHDRYLIDALGTQIWEIDKDEAHLQVYKGTYSEYRAWKEAKTNDSTITTRGKSHIEKRAERRLLNAQRKRKERIIELEDQISNLEQELREIAKQLENPPSDPKVVHTLGEDYVSIQNELENLISEWENLQE